MFLGGRAGVACATSGTGTLTLGTALGASAINLASFQSFANAGITDGTEVPYVILDSNGNWEYGYGTYTAAGTTLTRNVVGSNNSNSAINLSGSEQVFVLPIPSTNGDIVTGFPNCMRGFDAPVNLQINASVAANILTVAVKDNKGNDPTVASPIYIPFRDPTAANGDPIWRRVSGALSITTNATGASLGSSNSTAFRFWLVAFDNGGTVVLSLINCMSPTTGVSPIDETQVASSTAMSGSATSTGVFYTPNGTTLSNKSIRILGYVEYNSTGLATAGTYSSGPNFIQLFGPGIKKPCDRVQLVTASTSTSGTTTSATMALLSNVPTITITPRSAANLIRLNATATMYNGTTSFDSIQWSRGASTPIGQVFSGTISSVGFQVPCTPFAYDQPNTNAAQAYEFFGATSAGTLNWPQGSNRSPTSGIQMEAEEIMG